MHLVLGQHLGRHGSDGVAQDELTAGGQTGGGDLHDLAAVHLAQQTLNQSVLSGVAVAHERGILLQQTGKGVAHQRHATRIHLHSTVVRYTTAGALHRCASLRRLDYISTLFMRGCPFPPAWVYSLSG